MAITPDLIIKIITDYYGVTMEDLRSKRKSRDISIPRQVSMYLLRQYTDMTFDDIGDYLDKDHSTVMSGVRKIEKMIGQDPTTANTIDALSKRISPD